MEFNVFFQYCILMYSFKQFINLIDGEKLVFFNKKKNDLNNSILKVKELS